MTSFLYRTASRVLEPRAAIHPVVRPMFASQGEREPPKAPTVVEDEAVAACAPPAEAPPAPLPAALFRPDPSARTPGPSAGRQAALHPSAPARPGVSRDDDGSPPPAPLFLIVTERPTPPAPRAVSAGPFDAPETAAVVPTPRSSGPPAILPAPIVASAPAAWAERDRRPLVAAAFVAQPTGASRRRPSPERQSEEVQIHIGRIEVTAVAAEPARPVAVQPPRKAASLSAYLRRRDGLFG